MSIAVSKSSWSVSPPTAFDGFEILRPLGAGSMGTVYEARDQELGRLVAIKFIAPRGSDPHARERFALEARALARCQHPNIVSLFRVGTIQCRPYLVCELVAGRRLDDIRLPAPWPLALTVGMGLARAVAAVHERGVLHRDIKPSNVMISDEGRVKLLDFGLAEIHDERNDTGLPRTPAGTPGYMAPELWTGTVATQRTDLYALGRVLHELLIGPIAAKPTRDGQLPPLLVEMIDDCLSADPSERPTSAAQICDQLERLAPTPGPIRSQGAQIGDESGMAALRALIGELATMNGSVTASRPCLTGAPTAAWGVQPREP